MTESSEQQSPSLANKNSLFSKNNFENENYNELLNDGNFDAPSNLFIIKEVPLKEKKNQSTQQLLDNSKQDKFQPIQLTSDLKERMLPEKSNEEMIEENIGDKDCLIEKDLNMSTSTKVDVIYFSKDLKPAERSKFYNFMLMITYALGGFYFGYYVTIFSPLAEKFYMHKFNLDEDSAMMLNNDANLLYSIGAAIACLFGPFLSNNLGRFKTILLIEFFTAASYILFGFEIMYVNIAGRFLSGMISGQNTTISAIAMIELLPPRISFAGGVVMYAFLGLGKVFVSIEAIFWHSSDLTVEDPFSQYWRVLLIWPSVISSMRVVLLLTFFAYETPKYYLNAFGLKMGEKYMMKPLVKIYKNEESIAFVKHELINDFKAVQGVGVVNFKALFTHFYRRRFITGIFQNIAQQLSGINFFNFYCVIIFDNINGQGALVNLIFQLGSFFAAFLSIYVKMYFGRKANMLMGFILMAVSYLLLALGLQFTLDWLLYIAALLYITGFSIGIGSTLFVYLSEILPPIGACTTYAVQWIMSALVGKFMNPIVGLVGIQNVCYGFAVICVILFVITDLLCIETKGKTEADINQDFQTHGYKPFFLNDNEYNENKRKYSKETTETVIRRQSRMVSFVY